MERTLKDLENEYEIDLKKIITEIENNKAKLVLLQFPDGLKIYATAIVDYLEENSDAEFLIYLGSCFGACDLPIGMEDLGVDLTIQIGHNALQPSYLK